MIQIEFSQTVKELSPEPMKKNLDALLKRQELGFHQLPSRKDLWEQSEARARKLSSSFEQMVILGMGGSALGTKALRDFFQDRKSSRRIHVWDTVAPLALETYFSNLPDVGRTHFVLVSKSGSTLETLCMGQWLSQKLKQKGLEFERQVTVITEPKSNILRRWAESFEIECLEIPVDVGGRFSVLTPVSLLPAAFMDISLESLRQGAGQALRDADFVSQLAAQTLASFERQEWITLFWYYSDFAYELGRWTQQLWAESLAKKVNREGKPGTRVSTPLVAVGPADQHSILQQVIEGSRDKWVWMFDFPQESGSTVFEDPIFESPVELKGLDLGKVHAAQSDATASALDQSGVSVMKLSFENRSPESLGYYFMALELVIGTLGEALNINAFDQPGVELGKKITRDLLSK